MNTETEIRKALDYLGKHKMKQIYSKLLTEATLFRPKDPIPFFIDRLKHYALISDDSFEDTTHSLYQFPRVYVIICRESNLMSVVRAFSMNHNFELLEASTEQNREDLVDQFDHCIKKCMRDTVNETFLALNSLSNMNDLMRFERTVHEMVSCIHIQCVDSEHQEQNNNEIDLHTNSVLTYFAAQNKLCTIKVHLNSQKDASSTPKRENDGDDLYQALQQIISQ